MKFLPKENPNKDINNNEEWKINSKIKKSHLDLFLQTTLEKEELQKKLTLLYRENKILLEEQGYNSFYLALGFLEWTEIEYEIKHFKAPLILIPLNINRKKVSDPFSINWNNEEIRLNLSLKIKLQEQGIQLPEIKEFESKKELNQYLQKIKKAIENKTDWKVTNEIYLSNFSFKKFVMYNDLNLDNWDNINSSGIKNLFTGELEDYEYNKEYESSNSTNIFNVVDADSSQLTVLKEVKKNNNLVVEGPPGTGKSQTIVNIISELLARDKKILFVSEKKAALDVVKSRLDDIGLGEGCLEIHGKNSNKKNFLAELNKTLSLGSVKLQNTQDYNKLDSLKEELNEYVHTIHTIYKNTELNPFKLIGYFESNLQILENNEQRIYKLNIEDVSELNTEKRGEYINKLEEIKTYYDQVKPVLDNPWSNTDPYKITSPEINEIEDELEKLIKNIKKYNELCKNISNLTDMPLLDNFNIETLLSNSKILKPNLKLLKKEDNLDEIINNIYKFQEKSKNTNLNVLDLNLDEIKEEINNLLDNINQLNIDFEITEKENFNNISSEFKNKKEFITNSNLENALKDPNLRNKLNTFKIKKDSFLKRTFNSEFKSIKKEFQNFYSYNVSDDEIVKDLEKLIETDDDLSKLRNKILAYTNQTTNDEKILIESEKLLEWVKELDLIKSKLNNFKIETNNKVIIKNIDKLIELKNLLENIEKNNTIGDYYFNESWNSHKSNVNDLKNQLNNIKEFKQLYETNFFSNKTIDFIKSNNFNTLNQLLTDINETKIIIENSYNNLNTKLQFKNDLNIDINIIKIKELKKSMNKLFNSIDKLNNYRIFKKYCHYYSDKYTEELINLIQNDKIKSENIINLFYYNFANIALKDIFQEKEILDNFNYKLHEEKIKQFKELDKNILKSNIIRVKEILSYKRPNILNRVNSSSNLGLLQREMSKKSKIKPIRKILSETIDVISSIKPCFMMSPISIAQFLKPSIFENYFDYVIFDEASQVKIEDALGAMLRGKHYIIMGDTKQLPPTSFFDNEIEDYEENNELIYTNDVESILHLCKNTFDSKMLKWHYRSRHESLISVSNLEFYNNQLYVFPSPMKESEDLGLKFEYDPTTTYLRGNGRYNLKEAENVIEYAIKCVKKYGNTKSLGIGTFSKTQSKTIQDILDKKLQEHPELEQFFNETGKESFFIKNLENIQGDERDIILISIGYGKDQNNKFNLSFGPLNNEGGERRLNVLITRAKEQCIIFSNFKSSEMYTNETTPKGVKALKNFLYYAETKEFPTNYHTDKDFDSPFEESVYNFLTKEGYSVEKQVGCAGYRIDLAIIDKENANRYILAIECDGATYHSSRLARDRDRLRQQVLENLGWKFHRIWSTDWYHERKAAKIRLIEAIEEAIKNKNNIQIAKKIESNFQPKIITKTNTEINKEEMDKYFMNYSYYKPNGTNHLNETMIKNLIIYESPIHIEEIYNRIKTNFNMKATKKFKKDIDNVIKTIIYTNNEIIKKENFYYKNNKEIKVRKRKTPKIDYIPKEEIKNAIIATLKTQYSSEINGLIKESSKHLGFNVLRSNVKEKFKIIINQMIKDKQIEKNQNIIKLK